MEVSESLHARAVSALWIEENKGHWRSTLSYDKTKFCHRMMVGARRISQLLVLRTILMGDPIGQLSNACGWTECVNPYHYRDQSDREQLAWKAVEFTLSEAMAPWTQAEEGRYMQLLDIVNESDASISNNYGMTGDMGCYHCGARFDPLAHRNPVICPECWTDEDQAIAEANLVD